MLTRVLSLTQGVYFLLTGLWAIVHIRSFQWVTGKKTDVWLVKTVGVLVSGIGAVFILAGVRKRRESEIVVLATASAAGLTAIDLYYVFRRTISKVYLLDAALEVAFIAGWLMALGTERSEREVEARPVSEFEAVVERT
jgi:hypothetical protein